MSKYHKNIKAEKDKVGMKKGTNNTKEETDNTENAGAGINNIKRENRLTR